MPSNYTDTLLHIDGVWRPALGRKVIPVINPATEQEIGTVAHAEVADLDEALAAAERGFNVWRVVSAFERSKLMRKAADLFRSRVDTIAPMLTMEQGKPLAQARQEVMNAADVIDWFAEEGRRAYGRVIPARGPGIYQMVIKEPVGPVAAFTPWNFPINQVVRKLSGALATGCSIIIKAPEETPASPAELVRAFVDAGIPKGVVNLVFGVPAEISEYLIPHPVIRKVTFTGSTPVGKKLAGLAGIHMKRVTMELGGHSPAIVFDDADLEAVTRTLVTSKFRNAGQVCVSPTRFLIQENIYDKFVERFTEEARTIKVGNGLENADMGPLANDRRVHAIEGFVADARREGGEVTTGGSRIGNRGYFFEPTVVKNAHSGMRAMNEEPFGPIALMMPFSKVGEAIEEANRLPYGLASYAFTASNKTAGALAEGVESGMLTINHLGLALPETPFGGMKDSGYGAEGGIEGMDAYLNTKFVTQASA